jgi:hypothetical protein
MNKRKLELSYHPALKQVKFRRWENCGWTYIDPNKSILHKYITSKEGIILQNMGSDFFDDLGASMGGLNDIILDFKGTKLDYGDFKRMIEYYNDQKKGFSFSPGEFTELKDMKSLYQDIQNFSEDTINALEKASENDVLAHIKPEIQNHITDLINKKKKLDDNTVYLCFVGTYNSGKSTLISAILGYEILPEALKSETAKMFCIRHVENFNDANISFSIVKKDPPWLANLRWDEEAKKFCFDTEIHGSEIGEEIQNWIKDNGDKPLHKQLYDILTIINKKPNFPDNDSSEEPIEYIDGIINVGFPIPLCDAITFTIYDTPGTDSNYSEHLLILKRALEEQTNSILMFVQRSVNIEGTGNALIIGLLDDIKNNASKSTIDVGRSLYIVNGADDIMKGKQGFTQLMESGIKYEYKSQNDTTIKEQISLKDKRLFFISARAAYVARATKNGIATPVDDKDKKKFKYSLVEDEEAGFYRYNQMALSGYDTEEMIKEASEEAKKAKEAEDIDRLYVVNSGLFSLEKEIVKYGNKFAMAVKAKSIIDAVQYVIDSYDSKVKTLDNDKKKAKEKLDNEIRELRETLVSKITRTRDDFIKKEKVDSTEDIPSDIIAELNLSDDAIKRINREIKSGVESIWGVGFTGEWTKESNKKALSKIDGEFVSYYKDYSDRSARVIKEKIDSFDASIVEIINGCNIDDEAKERLLIVPEVGLGEAPKISGLVDVEIHLKQVLFLKILDKKEYIETIDTQVYPKFNETREKFKKDYRSRLGDKIREVSDNYLKNIDSYSAELERLRDDREAVERELELIRDLLNDIKGKKNDLLKEIWGGTK